MRRLAGLERLEYLNLVGTGITDAGVAHLESLRGLRTLYLWRTGVTGDGVERLKSSLPEAEVILDAESGS
jgi:hypothetical protein